MKRQPPRDSFFSLLKLTTFVFSLGVLPAFAQETPDSLLQEVTVSAYRYGKPLLDVPVAVAVLGARDFERFSNTSLLPAVNAVPGVRMEERSPGSYRFSIRGSLLRSPFGVRNVKMYWNGLPLTDGGGNTYLNLLDFNAAQNMEIIKGPGGSLYGAGTGGVVLLNSATISPFKVSASTLFGSYGLQRYQGAVEGGSDKIKGRIQYAHQKSDGFRDHTRMERNALNADVVMRLSQKGTLSAVLLYTDLFYETPGGLTRAQFDENPRQARLNAESLQAAIENKTTFGGLSFEYQWDEHWSVRAGVYASHTDFENPTFLNYENRTEDNAGQRMEADYAFGGDKIKGKITFGEELQYFRSPVHVNDNILGAPGAQIISDDRLNARQLLIFAQADIEFPRNFFLTVGASHNSLSYRYRQLAPTQVSQERNFTPVLSPRVALLKKLTPTLSVFASASKGFSPPTLAEVRPSTNAYNNNLKAEHGMSYEAGFKGNFPQARVQFNVSAYQFKLEETIIIQRTEDNADYFVNAGNTNQRGLEVFISWDALSRQTGLLTGIKVWESLTLNHYRFGDYINDNTDYSGNRLTGVAPAVQVGGLDVTFHSRWYINLTSTFTKSIPLNDGNTDYASEFFLLGARVGYRVAQGSLPVNIFAGVDNAFDERYSLGNDLNARAGRYYNTAPGRNYFAGISITPFSKSAK